MSSAQATIAQFGADDLQRESSLGYDLAKYSAVYATTNGATRGVSLQKLIQAQLKEYYNFTCIVPYAITFTTGATFKYYLSDDGTSSADLGLVVRIGITPFNFSASGALLDWSAGGGTETFTNVTLSSTSGNVVVGTTAIVIANMDSLAALGVMGVRIRRVGDNAADTCPGRVILYGGIVYDT